MASRGLLPVSCHPDAHFISRPVEGSRRPLAPSLRRGILNSSATPKEFRHEWCWHDKLHHRSNRVMAEYDGKRCAFLGDAYSSDIAKSISRMAKAEDGGDTLEIDAVKLSHHGGRKNTGSAMLEKTLCRNYLVSTDGSIYDHPHGESLSRVLVSGSAAGKPSLFFNYLSDETKPWGKKTLYNGAFKYTPVFPDDEPGISPTLLFLRAVQRRGGTEACRQRRPRRGALHFYDIRFHRAECSQELVLLWLGNVERIQCRDEIFDERTELAVGDTHPGVSFLHRTTGVRAWAASLRAYLVDKHRLYSRNVASRKLAVDARVSRDTGDE